MTLKKHESLVLFYIWLETLTQDYTDAEIGMFIRSVYAYAKDGTPPEEYEDRGLRGLWRVVKDGIDKNAEKYAAKTKQTMDAAAHRWQKIDAKRCERIQHDANASGRILENASAPYVYDYEYGYEYDAKNANNKTPSPGRGAKTPPAREEPVWEDL